MERSCERTRPINIIFCATLDHASARSITLCLLWAALSAIQSFLLMLVYSAGPILVLTQQEGDRWTYKQDWILARQLQNASNEGASTISSTRWFQSTTVLTKNECLYCSVWDWRLYLPWKFTADNHNRLLIFHELSQKHLFTSGYMP